MRQMDQPVGEKQWYVAHWPALAWLETTIKFIGLLVALITVLMTIFEGEFEFPASTRMVQWIVLFAMSLGLLLAIYDRIVERELVAMGFVIINNIGHWGMVIALMFTPPPDGELMIFAGMMMFGDIIKLWFLYTSGFTVRQIPRWMLYFFTSLYVIGYGLIVVLGLAV